MEIPQDEPPLSEPPSIEEPPDPWTPPTDPPSPPPIQAPPASAAAASSAGETQLRDRLIEALNDAGQDFCAGALAQAVLEEKGGTLVIRAPNEERTIVELEWSSIEAAAKKIAPGSRVTLGDDLSQTETAQSVSTNGAAEETSPLETETARRALADPDIQAFRELFPGQIREVRNLKDFS